MQTLRLKRDVIFYTASILLVRGMQIFLIPIYTRVLGVGEYGVVETVVIAAALVNLTVALEIAQGMARAIADEPDEATRRAYGSTAVGFGTAAYGLFLLAVCIAASPLAKWLLEGHADGKTLIVAAVALAVNGVFVLMQDLLRWHLRPGAHLSAGLAYSLGNACVGLGLVAGLHLGVIGVFWGQLAGAVLGGVVSVCGGRGLFVPRLDPVLLRRMLKYSLPLVVASAAVFGSLFLDRIIVREVLGLEALGIYGVTARFASAISILAIGLQAGLLPLVFRNWRDPATAHQFAGICRIYCCGITLLVGGLSLFSSEVFLIITHSAFYEGRSVLSLLSLGVALSTLYVFSPGLYLGERTRTVAVLNIVGVMVNLGVALALTPVLGLTGAAIASVFTSVAILAGHVVLGKRWFPVPYQWPRVAVSLGLAAGVAVLGMVWNAPPPTWSLMQISVKAAVLAFCAAIAVTAGLSAEDRAGILRFAGLKTGCVTRRTGG